MRAPGHDEPAPGPDFERVLERSVDPDVRAPSALGLSERPPRWVYVSGLAVAVLVVLVSIIHATGHGLGGHLPALPASP